MSRRKGAASLSSFNPKKIVKGKYKAHKAGDVPSGNWWWAVTPQADLVDSNFMRPADLVTVNHTNTTRQGYDAQNVAEVIAEALQAAEDDGRLKRVEPLA